MEIFIPSRARPGNVPTAQTLIQAGVPFKLVLTLSDPSWRRYLDDERFSEVAIPDVPNLAAKRQWIMDRAEEDKLLMLDDDVVFAVRTGKGFRKANRTDIRRMIEAIDTMLSNFAHVGIVDQYKAHARPPGLDFNTKLYRVLGYNKALFGKPPPRWDVELLAGSDHDFHLKLLTRGLDSCALTGYTHRSNKEDFTGGTWVYRRPEDERRWAEALAHRWPGLVTVGKNGRPRIAWKRARAQAQ